jgi:hypothetical protein
LMDECEDGPHRAAITYVFSAMKAEYLLILDALTVLESSLPPWSSTDYKISIDTFRTCTLTLPFTAQIPVRTGNNPDLVQHSKKHLL